MNTLKGFCEDILKILHKLEIGECSLKGHLAYKLFTIRKELDHFDVTNSNGYDNPITASVCSLSIEQKHLDYVIGI